MSNLKYDDATIHKVAGVIDKIRNLRIVKSKRWQHNECAICEWRFSPYDRAYRGSFEHEGVTYSGAYHVDCANELA